MNMQPCAPAKGYPAKYYFAGTPKAGAQTLCSDWTPAFAGEQLSL